MLGDRFKQSQIATRQAGFREVLLQRAEGLVGDVLEDKDRFHKSTLEERGDVA